MPSFQEKIEALCRRVEGNNVWRQKESFNLIPSESTPSLLVKMCEISDPAGRYAEHRTMKGEEVYFYQGIDFIRDVEIEAQRELAAVLRVHGRRTSPDQRPDGQRSRLQGNGQVPQPGQGRRAGRRAG